MTDIKLFDPIVDESDQHSYFKMLLVDSYAPGFVDRDNKLVQEFQTTFNAVFWELYLHAVFAKLNLQPDYSKERPDYVFDDFICEATVASHRADAVPESDRVQIQSGQINAMKRYSTMRISNAIHSKITKHRQSYSHLDWVKGKPFVIAIAPFDQPGTQQTGLGPIFQCIYGLEAPIFQDDGSGQKEIVGWSHNPADYKKNGTKITYGIFTDDRYSELSAIIFSNTATFGKVRALTNVEYEDITFIASRYKKGSINPDVTVAKKPIYQESLLDGLQIFLNPHAAHPFDPTPFLGREITIESLDGSYVHLPEGALLERGCMRMEFRTETPIAPALYRPTDSIPEWPEGELLNVGGNVLHFIHNHMGHYKGWTICICHCPYDEDWQWMAKQGKYFSLKEYVNANSYENPIYPNFDSIDVAKENAIKWIDSFNRVK